MKVFTLNKEILLPIPIKQAWSFFSNPVNLKKITPPEMNFDIISGDLPEKIFSGLMIQYSVSPLKGIKVNWLSEIKHVNEPYSFIDEQRSGPYSFWYHQHSFEEMGSNTRMTDLVYYSLPFYMIGSIANSFFVKKKLDHIFNYRTKAIADLFKTKEI